MNILVKSVYDTAKAMFYKTNANNKETDGYSSLEDIPDVLPKTEPSVKAILSTESSLQNVKRKGGTRNGKPEKEKIQHKNEVKKNNKEKSNHIR